METNKKTTTTEEILKKAQEVIKKNSFKIIKLNSKNSVKKQKYTNKVFVYHKFEDQEKETLYPLKEKPNR